jgi:hypothetical protein
MLSYSVNGETGLGSLLLVTVVLPAEESSILPARSSGPQVDHDLQCRSWIIVSEPPTALLIVDVQVGLVALMSASVRDGVLPKIKALLTEARTSGISVIYIQHDGAAGHPLETRTEGWEIYPRSSQPMASASSGSGNRTHFSELRSNRNLKKEGLPIS